MRKTKIICTIGPASSSPEMVRALIAAGMDCARLNFSHGDYAQHRATYETVRAEAEAAGKQVAILQDLQGPKVRVGVLAGGALEIEAGEEVVLTTRDELGEGGRIPTDYAGITQDVLPGDPILLDDGLLHLEALSVSEDEIRAKVLVGGTVRDHKGINLPGRALSLPTLTEKDIRDLEFGVELGVDYVALSFVQGPEDVRRLRRLLGDRGGPGAAGVPIIAKLERPQAVQRLEAIIAAADGIMVARGDLGVELPPQTVPAIQKRAIEVANGMGKLVITATQMLDSMTRSPRPTRAEVSDVANAVFDGTDAVMLSGETASGLYPIESAKMMADIVSEAEASARFYRAAEQRSFIQEVPTFQNAAAAAAVHAAHDLGIDSIVAFTESGRSAELISDYRPQGRVIAFSPHERTLRRMALYWGVWPQPIPRFESTDEMFDAVERLLLERKICSRGDAIILVAGVPPNRRESTNLVKLHRIE